ncbi:UNVERIFIED_ORG: AcrR family transcriptional regulator [Microbispora rosea subsp. rosea]
MRASALYRHYPSKQALLDAVVTHLVSPADDVVPLSDAPWDELLRGVASSVREVMLAHRDGARLISGFHHPGDEAVATFRRLIGALIAAGVPADTATIAGGHRPGLRQRLHDRRRGPQDRSRRLAQRAPGPRLP